MPRKRNEETEAAIYKAARKIILEGGYEAATYSALAKATGIPRTTVQHYLPFKEALATDLMQTVSDLSYEQAVSMLPKKVNPLVINYYAGQIAHSIYYAQSGLRHFLLDIATDRRLQYQISPRYESIAYEQLGIGEDQVDPAFRDQIIQAIGGVFDVLFVCLQERRFPDTQKLNEVVMRVYAQATGVDQKEVDRLVKRYRIDPAELKRIGARLARKLAK